MSLDLLLFIVLAVTAVVAALSMLVSRNAVYSALFLIISMGTLAVFYLMLGAPFLAMAQVTVYAGAIMVLFLFVIMLLGAEQLRQPQSRGWHYPVAILLGVVLLIEAGIALLRLPGQRVVLPPFSSLVSSTGGPTAVGSVLFNEYLLPFEITSVLLLVAMIGAIILTKGETKPGKS